MTYQLLKRGELEKTAAVTQQMAELNNAHPANKVHVRTGKNPRRATDGL
jgi:hypothetical protein